MNTIEELTKYGIQYSNAKQMLDSYKSKIGTMSGVYTITDITYGCDAKSRDVLLKCSLCGKEIHKRMFSGKNKWSELKKTCDCVKKRKEENLEKLKEAKVEAKNELIKSRVGRCFGDYEITSLEGLEHNPKYIMRCRECGAEKIVSANNFDKRTNFHCGKHYVQPCKYDESYVGKKKNYLTVVGITRGGQNNHRMFVCKCDCGNIKAIEPNAWEYESVKSCGCMHGELSKTHGGSKERLYGVWRDMKSRCFRKNDTAYPNYGGRGITVCEEWLDYSNFRDWALSAGYDKDAEFGACTIDRINVNGNYEPDNCRWISNAEQQKNKRLSSEWKKRTKKRTAYVTFGGEQISKFDLCKKYGISVGTFDYRVRTKRMSIEDALTTPKMTDGRPRKGALYE